MMGPWLGSVGMLNHGMTLNLGSAKVCSPAIFGTYFCYHTDIWIAATDILYFYLIVLSP